MLRTEDENNSFLSSFIIIIIKTIITYIILKNKKAPILLELKLVTLTGIEPMIQP
jgi:hypothetical protein